MLGSAWDQTPSDLANLGHRGDPRHLFGRLQRVATWEGDGPVLSRGSRELVVQKLDLRLPRIVSEVGSEDGSTRAVLELTDGARIEAVHMPRAVRSPRVTVCLSSQVGCAMGCTFCNTAAMGLVRNLTAAEIVGQLLAVVRARGPSSPQRLNLVFMGMGEPLHNVDAVVRALGVICDPAGLGIAPSRVTVSTAGYLPGIATLARSRVRPTLAVSVNAATDATRRSLMPVGKRFDLAALADAIRAWPRRPHEKVTLEYVLIEGINDDLDSADRLGRWALGLGERILMNVIPFNAYEGSPMQPPSEDVVRAFAERLWRQGLLVTVRRTRGRDVRGACGTLATESRR